MARAGAYGHGGEARCDRPDTGCIRTAQPGRRSACRAYCGKRHAYDLAEHSTPKMPPDVHFSSFASPITVKPRLEARLTAPCVAISVAMLSVSPLPTARNPRQSFAPAGTAGAAEAARGAKERRQAATAASGNLNMGHPSWNHTVSPVAGTAVSCSGGRPISRRPHSARCGLSEGVSAGLR